MFHTRPEIPERTYLQYPKGDYNQMRKDPFSFAKDDYSNGHQNRRAVEENWKMIKNFILGTIQRNIRYLPKHREEKNQYRGQTRELEV